MQTNNKLREACEALVSDIGGYSTDGLEVIWCRISGETIRKVRAAVAEPVKNCEVGTVGQQDERFIAFCNRHFNAVGLCDKACPCRDFNMIGGACSIVWAQMPYEEGGAK
ncbi:MAG: hypothetical protein II265_03575 [Clostridia bacterium]|nr:hypothetical protein [Clostridia bacterium]